MNEAQQTYLAIYSSAIRGWLANKYSLRQDDQTTAAFAHSIAHKVAKLGAAAVMKIKESPQSPPPVSSVYKELKPV